MSSRPTIAAAFAIAACTAPETAKLTAVSVLRLDRVGGCYANMTPSQRPDDRLRLMPAVCPTDAKSTALAAGADQVAVVVDYGKDVHFAETTPIPPPAITVTLDGQVSTVAQRLSAPQRGTDGRVYFVATFTAPAATSLDMAITATVDPSFTWTVPVIFQTVPPTPALSVLRLDAGRACFEDLTAAEHPVDPQVGPPVCPSVSGDPILAGIDQLQLVADYGAALAFDSAAAAPPPIFTIAIDGVVSTTPIAATAHFVGAGRVFFTAQVTAPATPSNRIQIGAHTAAAGGFNFTLSTQFATTSIAPSFTLLKFVPSSDCFANMAPGEVTIAPNLVKALGDICADPTDTTMVASVDQLAVVVDFGARAFFAQPSLVPTPSIALTTNGGASTTAFTLGPTHITSENHAYLFATARAPSTPAQDASLALSVPTGFAQQMSTHFSVLPLVPTIAIAGCGTPCSLTAGVGNATVLVSVPGPQVHTVTLRTLLDGVPTSTTSPVTTAPVGDHTEGIGSLRVPDTATGSQWVIEADLDGQLAATPAIGLTAPHPTATLACGSPCVVTANSAVTLTVVAPDGIHASQAFAVQKLSGTPIGGITAIDLAIEDAEAHTITGVIQLTAPSTPGEWAIDVSVDGYHAQSVLATVAAP